MRGIAARLRGLAVAVALTAAGSLALTVAGAQAVVVDMNQTSGQPAQLFGVQVLPGTLASLAGHGVNPVNPTGGCADPELAYFHWTDFMPPVQGLCWHGGAVMHANETFALTWDPSHSYWALTRKYIQQFLRDVATGSGTLTSPYAVTSQYTDGAPDPTTKTIGRAANLSLYGGGCIDYGSAAYPTCDFSTSSPLHLGADYPSTPATGACTPDTGYDSCVTDAGVRQEVTQMASIFAGGIHKPDFAPMVVVLLPQKVEACLDGTGRLCSAGSASGAQFCSYHSHVSVGGTDVTYVVQPWVDYTGCDEPNLPPLPSPATTTQVALDAGSRLVNPLSQAQIAAITNPDLDGWFGDHGIETNDGSPSAGAACVPQGGPALDTVTVGGGSYVLQREFNNGGLIASDVASLPCTPVVNLNPSFVVPSAVNPGDVVGFDGSVTESSLVVPGSEYSWNFGDGTTAQGPSPVHVFAKNGTYPVTLTTVDRGGYKASVTESVVVGTGVSAPTPTPATGGGSGSGGNTGTGSGSHAQGGLHVALTLHASSLRWMLSHGIFLSVTSNTRADGIVTVTIPRAVARRVGIVRGAGGPVTIGRGTVSGLIKAGRVTLHLRLSRGVAARLGRLRGLKVTVHLALAGGGAHKVYVAAGGF
jgi:hypothetical protein